MTQFNPEQQKAIDALGSNVIVSASAGAGKTTVLVARLMKRILRDGIRINEIVAMTFTEAAASEMKMRLLDSLNKEYSKNPSSFLSEQIALVETSQISTIHSFCLNIIKNYGYVLGINPKRVQNIMDDAMVTLYQYEAFNTVLERWIENDTQTTQKLLDMFSSNPLNFSSFYEAIISITRWLQSKKDPQLAINAVINAYQTQSFDNFPQVFKEYFFLKNMNELQEIADEIMTLVSISDSIFDYSDKKQAVYGTQATQLLEAHKQLLDIIHQLSQGDVSSYDTLLDVLNFTSKSYAHSEEYKTSRSTLEKLIKTFVETYEPLSILFERNTKQVDDIKNLILFTQDFMSAYQEIKILNNTLDFTDFEAYALNILRHNDYQIAKLIRPLYKEIMVDEFQDTNEYQDEIIRLISNGSNIFRVGDIKQSIYKFRGAKPSIMKQLLDQGEALNLYLSYNYRSKHDIVSYNNTVFDNLMNLSHGMTYSSTDHVNTGIPDQKVNSFPVEFHIIERGDDSFEETTNQQQANHIAQEIIKFHEKGMRFKDMVILVRGHGSKAYLKEAFENANIPHFIDDQSGFYSSEVIQDILQFLEFANDPHDYYLVKVLKSVFVDLSVNDIAKMRIHNPSSIKQALIDTMPDLYASIYDMISRWKSSDILSILQDIINFGNTYNTKLSLQDKTNVDFLLEKAIQYHKTNVPTLSGFVNFVRTFENDTSSEASPLSSDADVVTSMTIHKSKGLQFPIVFLWGMGAHKVRDHSNILVTDEDLGLGLNNISHDYRVVERNVIRDIIEYKQNHEELEESLRLLYVALTRPQQHLIIVDALKEFKQQELNRTLLFKHRRKSELLYAASPKNSTILRLINGFEIDTKKLPKTDDFIINDFDYDTPQQVTEMTFHMNKSLDLSSMSIEGMKFGTTLHKAIENLPHLTWSVEELKDYPSAIQTRLIAYNSNPFTQELCSFEEIYHETSYMNLDGEGIIDFYAIKGDRLVLVDFKSDNTTIDILLERYEDQINDYRTILSNQYPNHTIETYIYSFKLNQYIMIHQRGQ